MNPTLQISQSLICKGPEQTFRTGRSRVRAPVQGPLAGPGLEGAVCGSQRPSPGRQSWKRGLCRAILAAAFGAKAAGWGSPLGCKTGGTAGSSSFCPLLQRGRFHPSIMRYFTHIVWTWVVLDKTMNPGVLRPVWMHCLQELGLWLAKGRQGWIAQWGSGGAGFWTCLPLPSVPPSLGVTSPLLPGTLNLSERAPS